MTTRILSICLLLLQLMLGKSFGQSITISSDTISSIDTTAITPAIGVDKMNIMYRGLYNPITISAPCCEYPIIIECNGGTMEGENGKYTVKVTASKKVIITIFQIKNDTKTQIAAQQFRVKSVPTPTLTFCGRKSGDTLSTKCFVTNYNDCGGSRPALIPMMEDFDFDVYAMIDGFDLRYIKDGKMLEYIGNKGNVIPTNMAEEIRGLPKGSNVFFDNVKIHVPGGDIRLVSAFFILE